MMIYSLVCNQGGMLRVVESLREIYNHLPPSFPLKIFLFAKKPLEHFHDERFVWFDFELTSATDWKAVSERLKSEIKASLGGKQVDWIIGDFMTLSFYEGITARKSYDIHFLGRPFHRALSSYPDTIKLDDFHKNHFVLSLLMNEFSFLKTEYNLMKDATEFVVNSHSSHNDLTKFYQDVTKDKPVTFIPVSSELNAFSESIQSPRQGLYFHGRFHPQKGIHFLFQQDWRDFPLTIRGFESALLTPDRLAWASTRGITLLPWVQDSSIIYKEIKLHQASLFPSIYEPFGLSLQEALALGQICIAHRCQGGHEEQIEDGVNGFLLDFNRPDLKREIQRILSLPEEHLKLIRQEAIRRARLGHSERSKTLADYFQALSRRS